MIEFIFAEFGGNRSNEGDSTLDYESRLDPSHSSFAKHFPDASFTLYTDKDIEVEGVETVKVRPPFATSHYRYGWRANDWAQAYGLLQSEADIAIAIDSDLLIVNDKVTSIVALTERFGMCMPTNGRHIVWRDSKSECDGGDVSDDSLGCGLCHCTAFWALQTSSDRHRMLLEEYLKTIQFDASENRGARGPLSLWRASWATGISPYTLPREWCITGSNLGEPIYKGAPIPIILHAGHKDVLDHYKDIIE